NYYVVVRHRNHLAIMSSSALSLSVEGGLYDFTTGQSKAYGTNGLKSVGSGFAMIGGDSDGDGGIGASDVVRIRAAIGSSSYDANDINMNGGVGTSDVNLTRTNIGQITQVP
ncbi:MAG: hypothetical protein AAB393_01190, partial [Bacteroidota bacterium]